jgi:hypothetical protein
MMRPMKRLLLVPASVAFALACNSPDPGTTGADTSMEAPSDSETADAETETSDTSSPDMPSVEPIASIEGLLLDMQGAPLPSPLLQFCGPIDMEGNVELCIGIDVDPADGAFTIEPLYAGLWSIKVAQGPSEGRFFTGQAFQLTVAEGDMLQLSPPPIVVPETSTITPLNGPTMVDIDGGLSLTIDPALAQSPDFLPPSELGGVFVPQEYWRVTDVEGSPVIAAWSFTPFGVKSTGGSGFLFAVNSSLGLAADTPVVFHEIEKDNGEIHEIGTGMVNADASAIDVVPTVEGLHELTWLLVTQG